MKGHLTASLFVGLLVHGCGSDGGTTLDASPDTASPEPLPTLATLPAAGFSQVAPVPVQTQVSFAPFHSTRPEPGELWLERHAQGRVRLFAKEVGGAVTPIAEPRAFLGPIPFAANGLRGVCASEVTYRGRAEGPAGEVLAIDRDVPARLVCFGSSGPGAPFREVVVDPGEAGSPRAIWTFMSVVVDPARATVGAIAIPDDTSATAVRFVWLVDGLWDPGWLSPASRPAGDEARSAVLRWDAGGAGELVVEQREAADYPDQADFAAPAMLCGEGSCGVMFDGLVVSTCPGVCGATEHCVYNRCAPVGETCEARTVADFCDGAPKRCGALPDGCGGTVDCGGCGAGESCGGGGVPWRCGRYHLSAARLRDAYEDVGRKLCGVVDGPNGPIDLSADNVALLGAACPEGLTCEGNLCR